MSTVISPVNRWRWVGNMMDHQYCLFPALSATAWPSAASVSFGGRPCNTSSARIPSGKTLNRTDTTWEHNCLKATDRQPLGKQYNTFIRHSKARYTHEHDYACTVSHLLIQVRIQRRKVSYDVILIAKKQMRVLRRKLDSAGYSNVNYGKVEAHGEEQWILCKYE